MPLQRDAASGKDINTRSEMTRSTLAPQLAPPCSLAARLSRGCGPRGGAHRACGGGRGQGGGAGGTGGAWLGSAVGAGVWDVRAAPGPQGSLLQPGCGSVRAFCLVAPAGWSVAQRCSPGVPR